MSEEKATKKVSKKEKANETPKEESAPKTVKKQGSKKDSKHGQYFDGVEVNCICGASFTINDTIPGPVKVETCYMCHPTWNKDKQIKQVMKGRMEKFLEKQKKIASIKSK